MTDISFLGQPFNGKNELFLLYSSVHRNGTIPGRVQSETQGRVTTRSPLKFTTNSVADETYKTNKRERLRDSNRKTMTLTL